MAPKKKIPSKPKVRHVWGINPKTRVKTSKKKYHRAAEKKKMGEETFGGTDHQMTGI